MFELFDPDADVRIRMGTSLPHWYQPGVSYFVTFRTEDSMPVEVSRRWHAQRADWLQRHGISMGNRDWREQIDRLDVALRREFHETFSRQYLETLDKGLGACVLRRPELSKIVADALLHFDGDRYDLGDFVVMPNHVHAIVCLLGDTEIEAQCTSWKRFAAKKINQLLKARGRFWQEESFDHLIRSPEQFGAIQRYIAKNPSHLKAGEFYLYQRPVAGTFQVPSAASSSKSEAASTTGHGTWNVPATLEARP
jgi:putative transposase